MSLISLERAFNDVRDELFSMKLLKNGDGCLDAIGCTQMLLPRQLIVCDGLFLNKNLGWLSTITGFREGVIYVAPNPSNGLRDIIRHEFGHALAWIWPELFDQKIFKKVFNGSYWDTKGVNYEYYNSFAKDRVSFLRSEFSNEYVSAYAMVNPAEDFAETFMIYVKYGGNVKRFRKKLKLFQKLKMIEEYIQLENLIF